MTIIPRAQRNNMKDGDRVVEGKFTANSGLQVGSSGQNIPAILVVSQVIDFGAIGSGVGLVQQFAYTSGAVGTISSGDYVIPLNQPAESGYLLLPAQNSTGDTIAVNTFSLVNINPAAAAFKFLVLKSVGI